MEKSFETNYSHIILLVALGVAVLACYLLVQPYMEQILIAFIFALIFHPMHKWVERKVDQRVNLATSISCLLLTFIILLPIYQSHL